MNKNASLLISKHDFELVDGPMESIVEVKKKKPWNHGDKGKDHDGQGYKVGYLQGWFRFNFD
jgi:hypothetical protein